MELKVNVTEEHIARGERRSERCCPIACALNDEYPLISGYVWEVYGEETYTSCGMFLSVVQSDSALFSQAMMGGVMLQDVDWDVRAWVENFDDGLFVGPIGATLSLDSLGDYDVDSCFVNRG